MQTKLNEFLAAKRKELEAACRKNPALRAAVQYAEDCGTFDKVYTNGWMREYVGLSPSTLYS